MGLLYPAVLLGRQQYRRLVQAEASSRRHPEFLIQKEKQEITLQLMSYRSRPTFDVLESFFDQKNTGSLRELNLRSSSSPHVSPDKYDYIP